MLKFEGYTTDNKIVLSGVFRVYESEGLPLDILFSILQEKNAIPHWILFFIEATAAGMKADRILSKLSPAISDTYGSEMSDVVMKRLKDFDESVK